MNGRSEFPWVGFFVLFLTLSLVLFAEEVFEASLVGLRLFTQVVLPSLLPFFILSEVLYGLGMVHWLGVFFEPLMRPLFNVPGIGSFVLSMGLAAGYPMDAVLTAKIRRDGLCSRVEAERMLAFSNTADPLFIVGAVAVAMFGRPETGGILAAAHYAASLCVGLLYRFHGRRERAPVDTWRSHEGGLVRRAFQAMQEARREDGRSLGGILNDAIAESAATLIKIACFIVLFSVLFRVIGALGALPLLEAAMAGLLALFGLSAELAGAALQGLFEIDLGAQAASQAAAPLYQQLMVASAIIAWSGLSVHGQVASILTGTDIRLLPYVTARLVHALLAAAFTWVLLWFTPGILQASATALGVGAPLLPPAGPLPALLDDGAFWVRLERSAWLALGAGGGLFILVALLLLWQRLSRSFGRI